MDNSVKGFFKVYHSVYDNPIFNEKHKFSKREIYFDLLHICWRSKEPKIFSIRNNEVIQHFGEVAESIEFLANKYGISKNTLQKYLSEFEREYLIKIKRNNVINIIEIVDMQNDTQNDKQNDIQKNIENQLFNSDFCSNVDMQETGIDNNDFNIPNKNNNIDNRYNSIPTTIYSSYTRTQKKILDSVRDNEQFFEWLSTQRLNIERGDIESKFDNFYVEQSEQNRQYENQVVAKWHFVQWFERILKQCYGTEIFETFKDFSTKPKELKHPLRMLTANQITEFAKELRISEKAFKKHLKEFLETANDYRFVSFEEEKKKLFSFVNTAPENLPF